MLVLVTGAGGFAGRYLSLELQSAGHEVLAFDREFTTPMPCVKDTLIGDICDAAAVTGLVDSLAPDACIHLAALASVPAGQADPAPMLAVNIAGTMNILEAFRQKAPKARLLVVSTAHIYEGLLSSEPVNESVSPAPLTIYAISKAAADLATLAHARTYGLQAMTVRPNNHTGPGQSPQYVVPAFAQQVKAIATDGADPTLSVGNLESIRDFLDVRDVVERRLRRIRQHGTELTRELDGASCVVGRPQLPRGHGKGSKGQ